MQVFLITAGAVLLLLLIVAMSKGGTGRCVVVVLGDFGRSPRMQYHALSLANQAGKEVFVVAYGGSRPHEAVLSNRRIHLRLLRPPPTSLSLLPRPLALPLKALFQLAELLFALIFRVGRCQHILLQTPPCIPTFAVCRAVATFWRSRLVFDWHNFGYSLMALSLRRGSAILRLAELYERRLGRWADAHICVTRAMKSELSARWGIPDAAIAVLHDRPAAMFKPCGLQEAHDLFCRIAPSLAASAASPPGGDWCSAELSAAASPVEPVGPAGGGAPQRSLVAEAPVGGGAASPRADRPAVLVSSTSWTPDEDFQMLLDAVLIYDAAAARALGTLPRLLVVVTGSGPLRALFEAKMAALPLRRCAVRTAWLEAADYPRLLGSADLGVCLHASSSGLDLPMKVVDMFGSGLPVAALRYETLKELLTPGVNGVVFSSADELAGHLRDLLDGFVGTVSSAAAPRTVSGAGMGESGGRDGEGGARGGEKLRGLRRGAEAWAAAQRWNSAWEENVGRNSIFQM